MKLEKLSSPFFDGKPKLEISICPFNLIDSFPIQARVRCHGHELNGHQRPGHKNCFENRLVDMDMGPMSWARREIVVHRTQTSESEVLTSLIETFQ